MDQEPLIEKKEINEKKIDLLNEKEENNVFYKMNESQLKDYLIQFLNNNTINQIIENGLNGFDLLNIINDEQVLNKITKDNLHEKICLKKLIMNEIEKILIVKIVLDDGKEIYINLENDPELTIENLITLIGELSNNNKIFLTPLNNENEILLPKIKIIPRILSNPDKYSNLKVFNSYKNKNQNLTLENIALQGYSQLSNKVKTENIFKTNTNYNSTLTNSNPTNSKNEIDFNFINNNNNNFNNNNNINDNTNIITKTNNNNTNNQDNISQKYSNLFQYKPINQTIQDEEDNKDTIYPNSDYKPINKIPGGFSNVNIIRNDEVDSKDMGLSNVRLLSNEQPYSKYSVTQTKKINEIKNNKDKEELENYMKKGYGTFNNNLNINIDDNNNPIYSTSKSYTNYSSEKREFRNYEPNLTNENSTKDYSSYYASTFTGKNNNNLYNTNYELIRNKSKDKNIPTQDIDNSQNKKYSGYKPL